MCEDYSLFEYVIALAGSAVLELADEELSTFYQELLRFVIDLAYAREEMSESERDGEPFPLDDEIFDAVVYNAAYQLNLETAEGLVNGYTWLLLGSFLRNEAGRITRRFDSSFNEVNRMPSEEPTLLSKLDYLFFPEDYEFTYDGDDFESRFPDIRWQCDQCWAVLNDQEGFDDHYEAICRSYGRVRFHQSAVHFAVVIRDIAKVHRIPENRRTNHQSANDFTRQRVLFCDTVAHRMENVSTVRRSRRTLHVPTHSRLNTKVYFQRVIPCVVCDNSSTPKV
jgi:hypothetical protein